MFQQRLLLIAFSTMLSTAAFASEIETSCLYCEDQAGGGKQALKICHRQYATRTLTQFSVLQVSGKNPWALSINTSQSRVSTYKDAEGLTLFDTATFDFGEGRSLKMKELNRETHEAYISINFSILTYKSSPGPKKCSLRDPRPILTGGN